MPERPNPVYVKLIRPEGYEDVPPGALVHDAVHDEFEPEIVDFPTREEGDADDPRRHDPTGPEVAPPAVGPHNPAAGRVAHVLEIVLREMQQVGNGWRMSWNDFDGRDLRGQLDEIATWAWRALVDVELPDFTGGTEAAVERFIAELTDAQIDMTDDLATKWGNTELDGTRIGGFDMDRWREGFREGLRRAAKEGK